MVTRFSDSRNEWKDAFIGRERELAWLKQNWQEVFEDCGTRVCVLQGDSGFGKTRTVQKFYSWLSESDIYDPNSYWPDNLFQSNNDLQVNPQFDDFVSSNSKEMPWLWWGVRWDDPNRRNIDAGDPCEFINYTGALAAHRETISAGVGVRNKLHNAGLIALDIATPFIETLSGYGLLKSSIDGALAIKDAITEKVGKNSTIAEQQTKTEKQKREDILNFFLSMLDHSVSSHSTIPMILFLDDAHWMDEASIKEIVEPLLSTSIAKKLRLMMIITSWEKEWYSQLDAEKISFPEVYERVTSNKAYVGSIKNIGRVEGLDQIVHHAYPGLSKSQGLRILNKCDGNVLLLHEILLWIGTENNRYFFDGKNQKSHLSPVGEKEIEYAQFDLEQLQNKRFSELTYEIKLLLSAASIQGMGFCSELLYKTINHNTKWFDVATEYESHLFQSIRPHSVIYSKDNEYFEFKNKVYHRAANTFLAVRDSESWELLKGRFYEAGLEWLKKNKDQPLTFSQKENIYLTLCSLGQDNNIEKNKLHLLPIAKLIIARTEEGYYEKARPWFNSSEGKEVYSQLLPVESIPIRQQYSLYRCAFELNEPERGMLFLDALYSYLNQIEKPTLDELTLFQAIANRLGESYRDIDKEEKERSLIQKSMAIGEQISERFGEHFESVIETGISSLRIGEALIKKDKYIEALPYLTESLKINRNMLDHPTLGRAAIDGNIDAGLALSKVFFSLGKTEDALKGLKQCLKLAKSRISDLNPDSDIMRTASDCCVSLAKFYDTLNNEKEALTYYHEAQNKKKKAIELFGLSKDRIKDVSLSTYRTGLTLAKIGENRLAVTELKLSLQQRKTYYNEFGKSLESLYGLYIIYWDLCRFDLTNSKVHLEEAKIVLKQIKNNYDSPEYELMVKELVKMEEAINDDKSIT